MKFMEFCEKIKKEIKQRTGNDVEINEILKNNGQKLTAIHIKQENGVIPNLYMEPLYNDFVDGTDLETLIEKSIQFISDHSLQNITFDLSSFLDFEKIKKQIICQLINTERNKELLETIPHIDFLDLSIIFTCNVEMPHGQCGSAKITNDFLKFWNVSINELYQVAKENMEKQSPAYIQRMDEVRPMFFITNETFGGAAAILYNNILESMNSDLFLIPSSIHEFLALSILAEDVNEQTIKYYKEIIQDVNQNVLDKTEFLSDNLYYYDKKKKILKIL